MLVPYSSSVIVPFYTASRLNSSGIACFDQLTCCIIQCTLKNCINNLDNQQPYSIISGTCIRNCLGYHHKSHQMKRPRYLTVAPFGFNGNKKHRFEKRRYVISDEARTLVTCKQVLSVSRRSSSKHDSSLTPKRWRSGGIPEVDPSQRSHWDVLSPIPVQPIGEIPACLYSQDIGLSIHVRHQLPSSAFWTQHILKPYVYVGNAVRKNRPQLCRNSVLTLLLLGGVSGGEAEDLPRPQPDQAFHTVRQAWARITLKKSLNLVIQLCSHKYSPKAVNYYKFQEL